MGVHTVSNAVIKLDGDTASGRWYADARVMIESGKAVNTQAE